MKIIYTLLFLGFSLHMTSQVANDNCADAIPIAEVENFAFITAGATTDGPLHIDSPCPSNTDPEIDSIYNDVWYLYTPTFTGNALFTTCGTADFDTKIAAYNPGASCPLLDEDLLTCNEDGPNCAESTSEMIFPVTAGESYLLRIGGYGEMPPGLSGEGTFTVSEFVAAVENDFCNDAIEISAGTGYNFDSFGAITDGPSHDGNPCFLFGDPSIMADIWYSFTPDFTGPVLWATCGTVTFDTRLGVYGPDPDCSNLGDENLLACNDDGAGCPNYSSSLFFDVVEGQTFLLRLGGWNGATGNGTFDLINETPPEPPVNDFCANALETIVQPLGSSEVTEGTTLAAGFDLGSFVFPPCIGNTNGGEFAEVWYSFNNNGNEELSLNFFSLTPDASYYIDVWEDCATPTDTLSFLNNCYFLNGDSSLIISEVLGTFANTPTDYILRVSTRLTSDIPGDFSFQLLGETISSVDTPTALHGDIVLLPNPASSFINLKIPLKQSSHIKYTITDVVGKVILREDVGKVAGEHFQEVDICQLHEGIYFIHVYLDEQPIAIRFVKE